WDGRVEVQGGKRPFAAPWAINNDAQNPTVDALVWRGASEHGMPARPEKYHFDYHSMHGCTSSIRADLDPKEDGLLSQDSLEMVICALLKWFERQQINNSPQFQKRGLPGLKPWGGQWG
ncbi:MAG: hypothetical protein ABIO62_11100, partial [Paracoccaceae bacterium]